MSEEEKWKKEYLQLPHYIRHPAPYGEEIYFQACRKRQEEINLLLNFIPDGLEKAEEELKDPIKLSEILRPMGFVVVPMDQWDVYSKAEERADKAEARMLDQVEINVKQLVTNTSLLQSTKILEVRAEKLQQRLDLEKLSYNGMEQLLIRERKRADRETVSVNELSLANQELELRLKNIKEDIKSWDIPQYYKNKVLEEVKSDLKNYTSPIELLSLIKQLTERIRKLEAELNREMTYKEALEQTEKERERLSKLLIEARTEIVELRATLALIKADESIGKLVVECNCNHDGEFDAGQRHCRKCGEYLF